MFILSPLSTVNAGTKTHTTVQQALEALQHLDHRGATSADPLAGDGVGVLTQVRPYAQQQQE